MWTIEIRQAPIAMLVLVVALSGCAMQPFAPTEEERLVVPTAWTATTAAPNGSDARLSMWWRNFGDAELSALVGQALEHNTGVRGARANLRAARAQRAASVAGLLPALDLSTAAQRGRSDSQAASNQFQIGVDASWEIDLAGGLGAGVAAADADVLTSVATLNDSRVSIAAEVALAYIDLRGSQQRLAVARIDLAAQEESLQIMRWREQAGLVSALEVAQARTAVESTRAVVPALESTVVQTLNSLAILCGQTPGSLHARLGGLSASAAVPQALEELAVSLPADTLRQRPDVRAAEQRVVAAHARVDVAQAARYPSLRLSGSLGLSALTVGALSNAGVGSSLLAGIGLPLLDGGARVAQVEVRDAELEQGYHSYLAVVLQAMQEVEDALTALRAARDVLDSRTLAAEAALSADVLATQRYGAGLVDFQVVLDAQRSRLSTQDEVISAIVQLAVGHVQLYKAMGGGWPADSHVGTSSTTLLATP